MGQLARVTGDSGIAFSAAYARAVLAGLVQVDDADVVAAERAIIASRFHGSRAAYRRALAQGRATEALAREVIADELGSSGWDGGSASANPSAGQIASYYESFADTPARIVEVKPRAWWLGNQRRGLAIGSLAPPQVFGIGPCGKKWTRIRTADGPMRIRTEDTAYPLGTYPLSVARPAVVAALKEIQRRQVFERWFNRPLNDGLDRLRCANDELPAVAVVDLTDLLAVSGADCLATKTCDALARDRAAWASSRVICTQTSRPSSSARSARTSKPRWTTRSTVGALRRAVRLPADLDVVRPDELLAEVADRADEAHHELVRGPLVEVARAADLLDPALVHQHDLVGELHRLLLVVRDEDRRHVHLVVEAAEPGAKLLAHARVEGAERLVQQEHRRLDGQRARERHPLPLAAGELRGVALREPVELHELEQLVDPLA